MDIVVPGYARDGVAVLLWFCWFHGDLCLALIPYNVCFSESHPSTLPVFGRDSADRTFLRKWKWSQIILDEAHALKNASSARSKRLRRLASEARGRVMLTGTPLQNDLGELLNLLVFLLPGLFKGEEPGDMGLQGGATSLACT